MDQGILAMLIILNLGVLSRNNSLALAAVVVLGLKLLDLKEVLSYLDKNAIRLGIIILTIGILTPFVTGKITLRDIQAVLTSPVALVALFAGALTVVLSGRGLGLINTEPSIVVGIVLGSVIGVAFFKGVPIGPMTAAGIVAVVMSFIKH
ncbi:DUF441 domain-containing protein [Thermoanaerobacterium sp. DL9XJH110]|uniref:DUF441 domain-containing protein n=1 Tax=Thermoanaerobacterium sp. DL9XJH110 TaxID=3386643 RepID=UPI003BB6537B